ncbi:MAG: NADH-quinone oxidoreductase subunit D [Chloroflexaceae bacterium]|nr:NADH-quinone oxidoreductase subunit D [Chloroflexaceae bacterium]
MKYTLVLDAFAAAWRGKQQLVLTVSGETVTEVTYRGDTSEPVYRHVSVTHALQQMNHQGGLTSFAATLALCQAIEALCVITVAPRAAWVRCVYAEIERILSHTVAIHDVLDALGIEQLVQVARAVRQNLGQAMHILQTEGHLASQCLPGGVRSDVSEQNRQELLTLLPHIDQQLGQMIHRVLDQRLILMRTVDVGTLQRTAAEGLRRRGPLARASGQTLDMRLDEPYAAYHHLSVQRVVREDGDVHSRLLVLLLEAKASVKLMEQALASMPVADWQGMIPTTLPAGLAQGTVEAPRGMLRCLIESDGERLSEVTLDVPCPFDRLLARTLLVGAWLDNVVLIARSTDPCLPDAPHLSLIETEAV